MLFDPFVPMTSMLQGSRRVGFLPAADVVVSENDIVLTLDVPGLTADDLEIEALGGELVVRGERKAPQVGENSTWAHSERAFGTFERRIRLPKGVDTDGIAATMDNGVLSLLVPKSDELKPKTIAIEAASEQRELETATA